MTENVKKYDYESSAVEEPIAEPLAQTNQYLDDDESFLAGDDVILSETDALSIFQQSENVVSYEILNFSDDKGKPRSRLSLLNDPPILHITSSDEQSADFLLTREFTRTLAGLLKDVDRSYSGISPKSKKKPLSQESVRSWFDNVIEWGKENKFKAVLLGIVIILFIGYSIVSFS